MTYKLIKASAHDTGLPDGSVHCIVTSPPYMLLRKYSGGQTIGWPQMSYRPMTGVPEIVIPAMKYGLGSEPSIEAFIGHLILVAREMRRVLRDDGTFFCNLGDSFAGSGGAHTLDHANPGISNSARRDGVAHYRKDGGRGSDKSGLGIPAKNMMLIPERFVCAAQADGWFVRSDMPWVKRCGLPGSQQDRPTAMTEHIFMLTKTGENFFDMQAVKMPVASVLTGAAASFKRKGSKLADPVQPGQSAGIHREDREDKSVYDTTGRSFRNTDFFFKTWEGLDTNEEGDPLALIVNPKGFSGAHFACVDDQTEALTPEGWRYHDELKDGDLIAAYDPDRDSVLWQPASFHRYDYDGDLVSVEKRDLSMRLTPNHRCLVRRRAGHGGRDGWKIDIVRADALMPAWEIPLSAPFQSEATEGIGIEWAALVGWYITEGYKCTDRRVHIYQSQVANPHKVIEIRRLLDLLGASYTEHTQKRIWRDRPSDLVIFNIKGSVATQLVKLAPCKTMTPELANLPLEESKVLLDALTDGDGHRREDGRSCITQKDKNSIDLMQLLAMRLGLRAMIRHRHDGLYVLYVTRGKWLTLRGTNGSHNKNPLEYYKGVVWCPSVDKTFWMARRNGKTFITGNTFPLDLPLTLIRAATSAHGCCAKCLAPWERIVEKIEPETRQIKNREGSPVNGHGKLSSERQDEPTQTITVGWQPTCACGCDEVVPATVLDPFAGSGTTLKAAVQLKRIGIGVDICGEYLENLAVERVDDDDRAAAGLPKKLKGKDNDLMNMPLFAEVA